MTEALVLGGGGVGGIAWMTGLLAGLADAGQDVTRADVIVGTSAGATVGAQLGSGLSLEQLYARQTEPGLQAAEIRSDLDLDSFIAQMNEAMRLAYAASGDRTALPPGAGGAVRSAGLAIGARPVAAGLAVGAAAAMKATAWPALVIVGVLFAARNGMRPAGRFALAAGAALAVVTGPVLVTEPAALIQNTIMFPLGLTKTVSTAASPLPGHLLAATGPAGHLAAIALLFPPRTLPAAAWFLIVGLTLMFSLAPDSRWGYFVYPIGIYAWLWLSGRTSARPRAPAGPAETTRVHASISA